MLWNIYPEVLDNLTLISAYQSLEGSYQIEIPWIVWLLENPASPLALPGNIDLFGHDCMHLLLKRGFTPAEEAYVVGFNMGNDLRTNWLHLLCFKIIACLIYPPKYRLKLAELPIFDQGYLRGRKTKVKKNLNQICLDDWSYKTLGEIRAEIELEADIS
jgi:hypothetical protein